MPGPGWEFVAGNGATFFAAGIVALIPGAGGILAGVPLEAYPNPHGRITYTFAAGAAYSYYSLPGCAGTMYFKADVVDNPVYFGASRRSATRWTSTGGPRLMVALDAPAANSPVWSFRLVGSCIDLASASTSTLLLPVEYEIDLDHEYPHPITTRGL